MAKIIAIANQKGGVGKTTTAVNLAANLAAAEWSTLLIDLDPQGNATSGLGVATDDETPSSYEVLLGLTAVADASRSVYFDKLEIVPSARRLVGAEVELVGTEEREYQLKHALEPARDGYDFILIDCPPSLGLLTVNALTAADSTLVPIQCEYFALEGLTDLLDTISRVRNAVNPALKVEGILLTMADERTNLSRQVEEEVRSHLQDLVFKTVIPRNVRLGEAPSFGKPIILYDLRSAGAQSYLSLMREVVKHDKEGTRARA
jgi:chromosome partitioning protein